MKEQQIWIKTMDSAAEVGNLILALFEEDEDYSGKCVFWLESQKVGDMKS
ncbi:MAG: hypothetical protein ACLRW4_13970 [Ruminococcus sp.]